MRKAEISGNPGNDSTLPGNPGKKIIPHIIPVKDNRIFLLSRGVASSFCERKMPVIFGLLESSTIVQTFLKYGPVTGFMRSLDERLSVGRYTLTHELGRGSTAIVYKGADARGRDVCVKKSNLDLIGNWKARELFEREASVLEQLSEPGHPGIPRFIDRMDREDSQYLVLEYVDGKNLQTLVEEERCLTSQEGVHIALQALDILQYVHARNVIHRDIKPSNLVLGKDGKLRLIDYSTVGGKLVYPADGSTIVENYSGYMPPDFLNGKLDPKSDVYSLGATLFYALTGLRPIDALTKKGRLDVGKLKAPRNLRKILKSMTEPDLEARLDVERAAKRLLELGDLAEEISMKIVEREVPTYGEMLLSKISPKFKPIIKSFYEIPLFAAIGVCAVHVLPSANRMFKEEESGGSEISELVGVGGTILGLVSIMGGYITLGLVNPAFLLIPVATNLGSYVYEQAKDVAKERQKLIAEKAKERGLKPVEIPLVKIDDSYREELERRVNHHGNH